MGTDAETPSVAVVRALADAENVDPKSVSVSLRDHVDPEALDALGGADDCTVRFGVEEYEVTVDAGGGGVSVRVR